MNKRSNLKKEWAEASRRTERRKASRVSRVGGRIAAVLFGIVAGLFWLLVIASAVLASAIMPEVAWTPSNSFVLGVVVVTLLAAGGSFYLMYRTRGSRLDGAATRVGSGAELADTTRCDDVV